MPSVLILESDPGIRHLLEVLLARDGYATRCAEDGRAAIRAMAEDSFVALLVDISIWPSRLEPGQRRGLGFLHWLQRYDPGALQRVVAMSALADRDLRGKLPPVRALLHKPFSIDDLRDAVAMCSGGLQADVALKRDATPSL